MKVLVVLACFIFCCSVIPAQDSTMNNKRVKLDSVDHYVVVWDNTVIVSKEIETDLFTYKAQYQYDTKSFIKSKLNLREQFDSISFYLDSNLKNNLEIEIPQYEINVVNPIGHWRGMTFFYKGFKTGIYRDCSCGIYRGSPTRGTMIYAAHFRGAKFFETKSHFFLRYKNSIIYDFKYNLTNGIPTSFISYQDTNQIDKKIIFKNGLVDSIQSFYPNGNLMYDASLLDGKLNGDFVFWDVNGKEKLRVNFIQNKVAFFINEKGKHEWNNLVDMWLLNHNTHRKK